MVALAILLVPTVSPYISANEEGSHTLLVLGELNNHPQQLEKTEELVSQDIKCNCYAYQKYTHFPDLPRTGEILNNLSPEIGELAVFYYPKSGLYHYAKVSSSDGYNFYIDEANYIHCELSQRYLNLEYTNLVGFWSSNK